MFDALDLNGQPALENLDVLFLVRVEVQRRLLRRYFYYARVPEVECHLVGKYTTAVVGMVDDTSDDAAFKAIVRC